MLIGGLNLQRDSFLVFSDLCPRTTICPEKCECTDGIVQCQERGLRKIPKNLPHSAKEIKLMKNMINHVPGGAFKHIKNLNRIDLSSNSISTIDEKAFEGLHELTQICLYSNSIQELPPRLFKGLKKLQILLLNSNLISCLPEVIFADVESFSLLSLYRNNLQSFTNNTIRVKETGHIHLGENPLICDCNLKWIKSTKNEMGMSLIEVDSSDATCDWPLRMRKRKMQTIDENEFQCEGGEAARTREAGTCFVDLKCPQKCNCSDGTRVDCSNGGFRSIPDDIPRYTTELILNKNLINRIEADDRFLNMVNLRKISLKENLIEEIEDGAFFGASELTDIELSSNNLKEIRRGMFKDLPNLRRVSLRYNRIKCLKNDTFMDNKNLELLSLYSNEIRTIEKNPFENLPLLKTLNLYSNPLICNCHMEWLNNWHNSRPGKTVTGNPTCVEPKHLRNLPIFDLTKLDFECENNEENSCVSSLKCPPKCTCVKTSVRCHDVQLTGIPENIPLEVTELILSDNVIRKINLEALKGLKELKVLDLSGNMISSVPDNTFQTLIKLETLNLVNNYIKCIGVKAFHGLVSLKYLSLTENMISQIPETSFQDLSSLTHLYLGENKLYCDCDLKWLARLVQEKGLDGGVAKCELPKTMAAQALLYSDPATYRCENSKPPIEVLGKCNPCLFKPCHNGGTCGLDDEIEFKCHCPREFGGRYCENALSRCFEDPCKNGGQCHPDNQSSFWCECPVGFSGVHCELNIDDCQYHKCLNNATCVDGVNAFTCHCSLGFEGEFCENDIDLCDFDHNQCRNGAPCIDLVHDYECNCQPGFSGKNCEVNVDECADHKCKNGGKCVDEINGYTCACKDGYDGEFCEYEPLRYPPNSVCFNNDCKNGALCHRHPEDANNFKCLCVPGFTGEKCGHLSSVSFDRLNTFILSNGVVMDTSMNITFEISPRSDTGVLMYHNPDHRQRHLLIQLYNGKVRVSYYLGTTQGVVIETRSLISRLIFAKVEVRVIKLNVQVFVDDKLEKAGNISAAMENELEFLTDEKATYIGGLPANLRDNAAKMWHIVPDTVNSFSGCMNSLIVNNRQINFGDNVENFDVLPGCKYEPDTSMQSDGPSNEKKTACDYNMCENDASCEVTGPANYACKCPLGYGGPMCWKKIECNVEKVKHFEMDGCMSTKKIRYIECPRSCGGDLCCRALKKKAITSRFECHRNETKTDRIEIPVVRKCECGPC